MTRIINATPEENIPLGPSRNVRAIVVLLLASFLVEARDLLNPTALPPEALAWTAFAALGYLSLLPLIWPGHTWAFAAAGILAALNVIVTSLNPVDPYYLTHWDRPVESVLVALEGYALPLPLIFFAYRAYQERRRVS